MILVSQIIFLSCTALLLYTYLVYPRLVTWLAKDKTLNSLHFENEAEWPMVSILMAAYNEELVLKEKLESLLNLDYPQDRLRIYIGSDNSSDRTNEILKAYESRVEHLSIVCFDQRQGKIRIINQLSDLAAEHTPSTGNHIFLMTDASVMLRKDVAKKLVRHFKNKEIGMVDAHMTYTGMQEDGISKSENTYLGSEVMLKQSESRLWGKMIGPFGGCFAMRSNLFTKVPENFLVDDFYIAMKTLEQGYLAINDLEAVCAEQVSHAVEEEYRRKKRISTGNFQNLWTFKHQLNPFSSLGFAFISHKVIRWLGPFLMTGTFLSSGYLAWAGDRFFTIVTALQVVWYLGVPLLDKLLSLLKVNRTLTKHITYFNKMNLALLHGFFAFISGVNSSIWEPTKRS